ncbi:ABC transporter ATP-binding protein [Asticcacaulis taihuensis]|uniref:ABC-2 type transport system ATP-binding protein n=1 Tax=Asticcacaulis taihuensis TaxID=260084 RepID=A0A1G4RTH9_9CAUL|nr:ATP-binding cassette domain-containing protein [Asticcacaulis taihuensis]SCW60027.1 ABC-2 type transport system ATP-binding protein [Asticcacaulis taihuensis]
MQKASDVLRVEGLAKRFESGGGIDAVSISVAPGSITGFIGINGAGKSTTLRCILGLITPDAGRISLFGATATAQARRRIGFLPEERGLFPRDRARDAIAFHARLKGLSQRSAYASADCLLERIGLGSRLRDRIGDLSKGNAQRVQILCALAHAPDLLLLDEPFSGLDPVAQSEVVSLFAEFRAGGGAILFSTHAMAAAQNLCDRVVILANGRTVFEGELAEAAAASPHGAVVVTSDEAGLLTAALAVGGEARPMSSAIGEATRWRVLLPPSVTHPVLMRALAEHAVPIIAFEPIKADLESAFWQLAAPAKERQAA